MDRVGDFNEQTCNEGHKMDQARPYITLDCGVLTEFIAYVNWMKLQSSTSSHPSKKASIVHG